MCIAVFLWQAHPLHPFLLLLNRDEYHNRPTKAVEWWEGGQILGGRDVEAGGTWLASSRTGKLAFVTNFRELQSLPQAKSRGNLPVRFLQSEKSPMEFAKEVVEEENQYNGFNLILTDLCSKTMVYVTNRPADANSFITVVTPGIHVLSNARLDSDWPKALRLRHGFEELLEKYGEGQVPIEEMVGELMTNTVKDEENMLPGMYPPKQEYNYSSIFVDCENPEGHYGTRSTAALSVKTSGEVRFYEKYLEKEMWKEHSNTYEIEKTRLLVPSSLLSSTNDKNVWRRVDLELGRIEGSGSSGKFWLNWRNIMQKYIMRATMHAIPQIMNNPQKLCN